MNTAQLNRINYINILAMLVSAALAVVIPFELFLLSYAILGPGHYLTEISWLNNRRFFTLRRYDYLLICAVFIICLLLKLPAANLVFYTFGLSFILLIISRYLYRALAFAVLIAAGYFLLTNNITRTVFGLYIPTLIHVYLFTGAFILTGAIKDKLFSGYMSIVFFILCPVLLCLLFPSVHGAPTNWAVDNYTHFSRLNTITLRNQAINVFSNPASIILTRLIAFAYTYHYLNWFSKTRVINWHHIKPQRAIIIAVIWLASLVLYYYNYRLGIRWLFILSLVHVILEFPLNHRSFISLGKQLTKFKLRS